jgi:hypothetical protein
MSIKQISSNLELGLWNVLIDLLSDSQLFQDFIRWVYQVLVPGVIKIQDAFNFTAALRWSLAGTGFGILTGFLIALF